MEHTRVNPKTQEFTCTHCGVVKAIEPGLTSRLQDQIAKFQADHAACPVPVFKKGDIVVFCGEEAVVEENYGDKGRVCLPGQGHATWYWEFQGERVMPLTTQAGAKR